MTTAHVIPTWQLHHRLALSLEHSGVTPEQMAVELGVHVNSVHNYASGRRRPKLAVLRVWADVCGVDRKWLIDGGITDINSHGYTGRHRSLSAKIQVIDHVGGFRQPALV